MKPEKEQEKEILCFENRELSWLKFNERVLEEAEAPENPLGEKMNFLSIFQTNLDEFYMVRVGSLYDQMILNDYEAENKTNMRPSEQLEAISKRVKKLSKRHAAVYNSVMREVENYGISMTDFTEIRNKEAQYLQMYFKNEVLPLLSPMVISKKQPFPFMENESLYAVAALERKGEKERIGIIPCSIKSLPRIVEIPGHKGRFLLMEELILHFMPLIFRSSTIREKAVMRITRNADINADLVYDEDLDYRELMEKLVTGRKRLSPVRLEYSRKLSKKFVNKICEQLELNPMAAFFTERPLDLNFFSVLRNELYAHPELFYEKWQPQRPGSFDDTAPMIANIEKKDLLLYYPYERMNPMIQLLTEAAQDPTVETIEMTLYRLAKNSQIVDALVRAVEAGKKVTVLVELKARFDEENNIHWTHLLEDAGCSVYYGFGSFKVHSKLLLIRRNVNGKKKYITQIGTGNYNENTARLYSDLCYMTARKSIALDAEKVFQGLWSSEFVTDTRELMVAPKSLQNRILDLIQGEIDKVKKGRKGYVGLKLNSMTDKEIMEKLSEASNAGVRVDLMIRGINCLIPGIPGKTENVHAYSIVGRFLEHARIYIFGTKGTDKIYISSADLMTRNTLRRVEVATPIHDKALRNRIRGIFEMQLQDNVKLREENAKGDYRKRTPGGETPVNSQERAYLDAVDATKNGSFRKT